MSGAGLQAVVRGAGAELQGIRCVPDRRWSWRLSGLRRRGHARAAWAGAGARRDAGRRSLHVCCGRRSHDAGCALAAAEQSCCSLLEFEIGKAGDELDMTVTAPADGQEALRFIFLA
jgi:hypothetical protein